MILKFLTNSVKYICFLFLCVFFMAVDFYICILVGFNVYLLFLLMILEVFFLGSIAGAFSKPSKKPIKIKIPTQPQTTTRDIIIQEHIEELKKSVFRPLEIKQIVFEKLEAISKRTKNHFTPIETIESVINEMYLTLKKAGDI